MSTARILLFAALIGAAARAQPAPVTAIAGDPVLIETGSAGTTFAMTEAAYRRFVEQTGRSSPLFVEIRKTPAALSPRAQFGINLSLRGQILSWVLDGDDQDGYVFYGDWNGNGDLTDDPPMRFETIDGRPTLRVRREERDGSATYPVAMTLVLDWLAPPGKTEKQLAVKNYNRTTRTGELTAGGRRVAFRLTGSSGFYSEPFHTVAFDLDADGAYNPDTEVFRVAEKYVNIGDTSYEFAVDPHGARLTLTPLAGHRPGRLPLTVGSAAPDFSFTDTDGRARRLSDFRGKVVLLDFWGAWCAPCVAEAPKLVAAYDKYRERGFEIIGIDTIDTREKMQAFIETHKMRWTQTMEPEKGAIQTLYRVNGFPSYFIVGADGIIKVGATGSNIDLDRELRAIFP
jgi:peroxiredoxin